MRKIFFLIQTFLIIVPFNNIHAQSEKFDKSIIQIVKALGAGDSGLVNQFIHPQFGIVVLLRRGTMDRYEKANKIDFNHPIPEHQPYSLFKIDSNIKYQQLPTFDCGLEKWSKIGLYCDTTFKDNILSTTAKNLKEFMNENIPVEIIEKFVEIDKSSRRIVLVDNNGGEIIFYLTLIENKWYLTIIDRVTSDCSS